MLFSTFTELHAHGVTNADQWKWHQIRIPAVSIATDVCTPSMAEDGRDEGTALIFIFLRGMAILKLSRRVSVLCPTSIFRKSVLFSRVPPVTYRGRLSKFPRCFFGSSYLHVLTSDLRERRYSVRLLAVMSQSSSPWSWLYGHQQIEVVSWKSRAKTNREMTTYLIDCLFIIQIPYFIE